MAEYLGKIKSLADEVACTATALSDPEIVSKILAELDMDYNLVVLALAARVEPITVQELYSQLLSFDARLSLLHGAAFRQSSANAVSRGRGRGRGLGNSQGDSGYTNNYGNTGGGSYNNSSNRTGGGGFNNNTSRRPPPPPAVALAANSARRPAMRSWTAGTVMMKTSFQILVRLLQLCVVKEEKECGMLTQALRIMSQAS